MGKLKIAKETKSKTNEETTKKDVLEWPAFLDERIMDVIKNDFKFESMTPVQSVVVPIFSQVNQL